MHERERHNIILAAIQERPIVMVRELLLLTGVSEATIRRDIATLHKDNKLRRVRGGIEALEPIYANGLAGRPFSVNESINIAQKRAIAEEAAKLCTDGDSIIINGGTTTFQMVYPLAQRQMQIFTNSFPIAEHLLKYSRNNITVPGGTVYREQNIILSPFDNDVTQNFYGKKMFMGAQGIGPFGIMEADPLLIQAEQKLLSQAEDLVVMADSAKFSARSSMILCPLERVSTIITDENISNAAASMIDQAGITLIVARPQKTELAQVKHSEH